MAIHKKTEGRDLEEYLQEVWDSLEPAWDKSKFDMKQGYDSEYECDCITITSKDNEGVRAKIYVNDYEGKHPVGFDVVYRYPGDKGVGVMGSYEFQSTDMDNLGEEVFDYFDEIKKKVGESMKSEADATFKVGDFVNYDAESDGKDVYDSPVPCEVVDVNDDGTLGLCVYGSYADEEGLGENASASCCSKLDHYAGMVDANTYYTDGKYKAYKGGWEILVTEKELDPKVYEFIGTMDDLSEVVDFDDYYGGENFVYDEDLRDDLGATGVDTDGVDFADMSGDVAKASGSPEESKQTEGLPPKKLGDRRYRSRADLINKMKQLGATEITTRDQYDELRNKQWLHKSGYAMDINGNLVGQTYFGDKDGKWYYATTKTFQGDYLPECKEESKKSEGADDKVVPDENDFEKCPYCGSHNTDIHYEVDLAIPADVLAYATCKDCGKEYHGQFLFTGAYYGKDEHDYDPIDTCPFCGSKEHTETVQFDGGGYVDQDFKCKSCGGTWYNSFVWSDTQSAFESHTHKSESKKSERAIPVSGAIKQKINDGITQCLSAIKEAGAVANPIKVTNSTDKPKLSTRDTLVYAPSYVYRESGMERNFVGVMFHVEKDGKYGQLFIGWDKKNNRPFVWAGGATFDSYDSFCNDFKHDFSECFKTTESKKSESLTLKQKELKDMARFGQAEDITTISDEEAKALRKKGIETIGISRGTYGMNGALLRDNEGNRYVITARSSNLFYFV